MRKFFHKLRNFGRRFRRFSRDDSARLMEMKNDYPRVMGFREMLEKIYQGGGIGGAFRRRGVQCSVSA
jgi:hypothetical protein